MPKLLHLPGPAADEQTRQIHRMLSSGLQSGYESSTAIVGKAGLRNFPTAVLRLRRERPDITYCFGISALAVAVLSGHRQIFFSPDRFAGPRALRWIRSLMDRGNVTFISQTFTQHRLAISRGIDPARCRVIQPGVDFGKLRRRNNVRRDPAARAKWGLLPDDFVILCPGESTLQTGHDQAVWTCGILNVLDPNYKLLLWGRGARAKTVADLGHRLRQPLMVKVAGALSDDSGNAADEEPVEFEELLSIADLCLVTAAGPCPTLPIATTMAAGVPIVSTVTYMLAELLEDRHTALMVPRRSPRALAQRIMDLRQDPQLMARLVDTARAEAYEHFSMTRMLGQYRELFEQASKGQLV